MKEKVESEGASLYKVAQNPFLGAKRSIIFHTTCIMSFLCHVSSWVIFWVQKLRGRAQAQPNSFNLCPHNSWPWPLSSTKNAKEHIEILGTQWGELACTQRISSFFPFGGESGWIFLQFLVFPWCSIWCPTCSHQVPNGYLLCSQFDFPKFPLGSQWVPNSTTLDPISFDRSSTIVL